MRGEKVVVLEKALTECRFGGKRVIKKKFNLSTDKYEHILFNTSRLFYLALGRRSRPQTNIQETSIVMLTSRRNLTREAFSYVGGEGEFLFKLGRGGGLCKIGNEFRLSFLFLKFLLDI